MRGVLKTHLKGEDEDLYPMLLDHKDEKVRSMAQDFITKMGGIKKVYSDYNDKWKTVAAIKDSPDSFISDTRGLIEALAARIEKEDNQLYALVDKNFQE